MADIAPERVLPTLNQDGTRRWLSPRQSKGRYLRARQLVGYGLVVLFVALPFLRIGGHPAILLNLPERRFHLFGALFRPTDGVLLMLLMLSIFVTVFLLTALFGRVWCGWGCPQTVYMELVFRPIERLVQGKKGKPGSRRPLVLLVFGLLSVVLGNVFLSYFVGVDTLRTWMTGSPLTHPAGFAVMGVTSLLVFVDFAYFREQMCTVACPYARFQSVLLDKRSLIVGYDVKRGEPRGKKGQAQGDCIDCKRCVTTCPTGIDIREGLQLECITCTQCIDACDEVMDKVGRPRGLIRYTSQAELAGEPKKLLRPRVVLYPLILTALVSLLIFVGGSQGNAEVTVLRGLAAPYVVNEEGVRNQIRVKVENRGEEARDYSIELLGAEGATLIAPENPLRVAPGEQRTTTVFVVSPQSLFQMGEHPVEFLVKDGQGFEKKHPYRLLGPFGPAPAASQQKGTTP